MNERVIIVWDALVPNAAGTKKTLRCSYELKFETMLEASKFIEPLLNLAHEQQKARDGYPPSMLEGRRRVREEK